ncbi:MAG: hypothetical protein JWL65_1112 [Gammaproteobacteria bacterium]|nr:hypothetical protein [Gammaproteobacteria bacterium]
MKSARHSALWPRVLAGALASAIVSAALASSHREAPFITTRPKVDGTDFYMFNSYETGRAGFVTLIANYQGLQQPQAGPNYFTLDPNGLYEIHIDNSGDGVEDLTFQFRFATVTQGLAVMAGTKSIPVPLVNIGQLNTTDYSAQNVYETYTLTLVQGDRRTGTATALTDASTGSKTFTKPYDNIGAKSIPNYATYANSFIHSITIPGCSSPGKVFVGQRQDGFVVNLGETFDLVNIKYPAEELYTGGNARNLAPNSLANYNVTSLALEIPASCLVSSASPIIGAWTTASVRQAAVINPVPQNAHSVGSVGAVSTPTGPSVEGGAWAQVSRLGAPLVNEVVIGLPDKDLFNASQPKNDGHFADYVTNPSLPVLLQTLFGTAGVKAPNVYPRTDLEAAFLTGVSGLNQPPKVTASEMLRLNTSTAVTPVVSQSDLGVLGGDTSGFPNGRRPIDDVVDIELRVAMGALLSPFDGSASDPDPSSDVSRQLHYTDGAEPNPANYLTVFPYLNTPIAGSPTSAND